MLLDNSEVWKVFITVGSVLFVATCLGILGYVLDQGDQIKWTHVTPEIASPSITVGNRAEDTIIPVVRAVEGVLSPCFRSSCSWSWRCWGEMQLHHPYVNLFTRYIKEYPRALRALSLLIRVLTVLSIQAVIFANNTLCDSVTEIECEAQWLTAWTRVSSVCVWEKGTGRDAGDHCGPLNIGGDFQLALKVALLSAVVSIPPVLLLDWLIIRVLAAQTTSMKAHVRVSAATVVAAAAEGGGGLPRARSSLFLVRRDLRRRQADLLEARAASLFGCSVVADVENFQRAFAAFLRALKPEECRQIHGESILLCIIGCTNQHVLIACGVVSQTPGD